MTQKVLFAINSRQLEETLEHDLKREFEFVGSATYREILKDKIAKTNPDIVLIREGLPGKESILNILFEIRTKYKNVRVIFMTAKRKPGDMILSEIVSYGIYDIILGEKVRKADIVGMLRKAASFEDASYLRKISQLDERNTTPAFDVQTRVIEKTIIEYVPVPVVEVIPTPESVQPIPILETVTSVEMPKSPEPLPEVTIEEKAEVPEVPEVPIVVTPEVIPVVLSVLPEPTPVVVTPPLPTKMPEAVAQRPEATKRPSKKSVIPERPIGSTPVSLPAISVDKAFSLPIMGGKTTAQSKKIVTFVGAGSGVGNTQIAFNEAVKLGQDGHRVIFLELHRQFSTIDFAFQLGSYNIGIDKALKELQAGNPKRIVDSIITMDMVLSRVDNPQQMQKNYKKMPKTLDFMFYSQDYETLLDKPEIPTEFLKDLVMYLLLQENYDYVIVDAEPFGTLRSGLNDILSITTQLYVTFNQDVAQIGQAARHLLDLQKRININGKVYYIANKYEACSLDVNTMSEWLNEPIAFVFPYAGKEFIQANFLGIPFIQTSKNKELQQVFENLKQHIVD